MVADTEDDTEPTPGVERSGGRTGERAASSVSIQDASSPAKKKASAMLLNYKLCEQMIPAADGASSSFDSERGNGTNTDPA